MLESSGALICQRASCRMRQAESSDDEEHFRKKEQRRTERDTAKLRPLILSESLPHPWLANCMRD